MKRKRGNVKPKPKKPSLVEENETNPKVVGLNDTYSLENLMCEYEAMDSEMPQDEPSLNDHQAALEQVVANTVNSVRNTSTNVLGNLSKLASSKSTQSSRGAGAKARVQSNMNVRQADSENGGAMMGFNPTLLREMIISIISDLSKQPGGITANQSTGIVNNPISNVPVVHSQGQRTHQEVVPTQNPQYKEQELNASLSVIKKIMKLKAAEPFSVPVDPIALGIPDYFDVVDTPMDLGTICYNLENGHKYMNSVDVYKDVQHIWENCSKYNKTGDYILDLMKQVRTNFMKYWTAAGLHKERDQANEGHLHLHLTTEPNMRQSMHRQDPPVIPVSERRRQSQTQFCKPPAVDNQPQLSSNQPHLSQRHTAVNTSTAGYSQLKFPTKSPMRRKERPVGAVSGRAGPSQMQFPGGSTRDNQPQLNSNHPHQRMDLDNAGFSHSPPPDSPVGPDNNGKECQAPSVNLINQQNNESSSKKQYYRSPLLYSPQQDDANRDLAGQQNKRNVRGPTRCLKLLTALGRIPVSTNEFGQPVGDEACQLTSFLGLMARDGNIAPLTYPNWSKVPKENKEVMWQKVQSKFDIDPACKTWVLNSLSKKWRNFKSNLKSNHYDTHSTDAERLADRDPRVLPDQWSFLVSNWGSEKWQVRSAKNKEVRAHKKFSHATGKKSFARIREEEKAKRPDGTEPSRAELFIMTRTRKDGQPVNEATAAVISQLRERTAQQPDTTENNNTPQGDILDQVVGPDTKGNPRLRELGPAPTVPGAHNINRADAMRMVSEANAKVYEMNEKMVSMQAQMSTMMSMMASMHNSQNKRTSFVVAETSDHSEDLREQSVHTPTSRRVVPARLAREKQARKRR